MSKSDYTMSRHQRRRRETDSDDDDELGGITPAVLPSDPGPAPPPMDDTEITTDSLPMNLGQLDRFDAFSDSPDDDPAPRGRWRRNPDTFSVAPSAAAATESPTPSGRSRRHFDFAHDGLSFKRDGRNRDQRSEQARVSTKIEELGLSEQELQSTAEEKAREVYKKMCQERCPQLSAILNANRLRHAPIVPDEFDEAALAEMPYRAIADANAKLEKAVKDREREVRELERTIARYKKRTKGTQERKAAPRPRKPDPDDDLWD